MRFNQFDQRQNAEMGDLGQQLFQQATDMARAQAAAVQEGVKIGEREQRGTLRAIVAAYDRAVNAGMICPSYFMALIEDVRRGL